MNWIQLLKGKFIRSILNVVGMPLVMAGTPAIITNSEGKILLGKRNPEHPFYPGYWGLPGGFIDYGEKSEDACKREIEEELGVEAKIIKQARYSYDVLPNKESKAHSINIPYFCKIKSGKPQPKDETKEVKWFNPKEIKNMELAYTHKEILKKEGMI